MKKQWKRVKSDVYDAKLFVLPIVLIRNVSHMDLESGLKEEEAKVQRKLEEGAVLSRWLSKHRRPT